jgi:hypothetical protein
MNDACLCLCHANAMQLRTKHLKCYIVHLSFIKISIISNLGVSSGASKMISEPTVRSTLTVHPSSVKISNISKRTESSLPLGPIT